MPSFATTAANFQNEAANEINVTVKYQLCDVAEYSNSKRLSPEGID